jgi:uncharacterized protein
VLLRSFTKILKNHQEDLLEQGVRSLAIFGSVARNENKARSDIDILIDFDSKRGIFAFVEVKTYLEEILNCKVDLVTKKALHPALKTRILKEAKHVF